MFNFGDALELFKYLKSSKSLQCVLSDLVLTAPCVVWLDNFSKTLARQHPTVERGVYTPMLWTVSAVKTLHASVARSTELVFDDDGVISAMPPTLLGDHANLTEYLTIRMSSESMFDTALCVAHSIKRVPPKLPDDAWVSQEDRERVADSVDGLTRFHPLEILQHNIGSNEGLMRVIRHMDTILAPDRYAVIVVDINIYMRLLKVPCRYVVS